MKKISLIHPFTPSAVGIPESQITSSHSRPHVLAMAKLAQNGYNCRIEYFTTHFLPYSISKMKMIWKFQPVSKRWNGNYKKWRKQWSFLALWNYWWSPPDLSIINMSGFSSPFSIFLSKLILRKNKKYIAMLGGHTPELDLRRIEYYRHAALILVHTKQQKEEMLKRDYFKGCDIRVFPLGVNVKTYIPTRNLHTNVNIQPKLLFVGRILELKRIHLCIEALFFLKKNGFTNSKLRIIGPISSLDYYNNLQKIIEEKDLCGDVAFEGFIEYNDLVKYYQDHDLLLLPSKHESFGMVMVESMACGTPVAAIENSGGPVEIIQSGVNGILTKPETYAQEIIKVFQNIEILRQMQFAARKTVERSYSSETTFEILKKSVEDCLIYETNT